MKIAVDNGPLTSGHKVRGVGFYTRELLKALGKKVNAVDFASADLTKYDLAHWPFFNLFAANPAFGGAKKKVVTIHDVVPLLYPKQYEPGVKGTINLWKNRQILKTVDAIITDTETSKKDIVRFLGVPAKKIFPIYLAAGKQFKSVDAGRAREVKKKYKLPDRFALYLGDVNYNKNVANLAKACGLLGLTLVIVGKQAGEVGSLGLDLKTMQGPMDWLRYVIGKPHPQLAHFNELARVFKKYGVIRLGFVEDEDLAAIFNLASVYVQPSYYEGFGLPVLQAMASGLPVVVNKTNALVEVAGGAAEISGGPAPGQLAKAIDRVLRDSKRREKLIELGRARAREFSWEKVAKETLAVYEKV